MIGYHRLLVTPLVTSCDDHAARWQHSWSVKLGTHWRQSRLLPNFVADTVDFVARVHVHGAKATRSTFNKVDRVEFNFVASVYRALSVVTNFNFVCFFSIIAFLASCVVRYCYCKL